MSQALDELVERQDRSEIYVSSALLRKAADLLEAAEPSVVNGHAEERPGWLRQDKAGRCILQIGIFSAETHIINRAGEEVLP